MECLGLRGYRATLVFYIVVPLVAAASIVLVTAGRVVQSNTAGESRLVVLLQTSAPAVLQLSFITYPLVATKAFEAFSCYKFTESRWLKADVAIQCYSEAHDQVKGLAWVAIVLYPCGLLALNAALLFKARHAIRSQKSTALSRSIAFLHREYLPHLFWWELIEMTRRFVLVGLMVLVQDSMMQLVIGTLLAAAFLLFQVQASPYINMTDDLFASAVSFCLVVVFLVSASFKYSSLIDLPDIQNKMSNEQTDLYVLNQAQLTGIIIGAAYGALMVSGSIFTVQFAAEGARRQREALASKARRLRFVETQAEVEAPEIDGKYHLFLSHVVSTQQK